MKKCLLLALFLLIYISGSAFAVPGNLLNWSYLSCQVEKSQFEDSVNGTLHYTEMEFIGSEEWDSNQLTGTIDITGASATGRSGVLPNEILQIYYLHKNGRFIHLGDAQTDAEGMYGLDVTVLRTLTAEFADGRCTRILVNFTGSRYNIGNMVDTVYCTDYDFKFPLLGVDYSNCISIFIILGVLIGAMYASGMDPLKTFDLSTPRLPSPKYRAMSGMTMYVPGWAVQREAQIRQSKEYARMLERSLRDVSALLANAGGKRPISRGQATMVREYGNNKDLIERLRKTNALTITQKSMLTELILLGLDRQIKEATKGVDKKGLPVAGVDKSMLRDYLVNGNTKELKKISRNMDSRSNTLEMGKVRLLIRKEVGRYQKEINKMDAALKNPNEKADEAWEKFTRITGMELGDGKLRPGLRDAKEQNDFAFDVSRKWLNLGSEWKPLDKVGKFIATTPGLRRGPATAIGSVLMITGIYGRVLRTAVVDGVAGNALKGADKLTREKITPIHKATVFFENKVSEGRKSVGSLMNGFEESVLAMREIAIELKRREILTKKEMKRILVDVEKINEKHSKILNGNMSKEEKVRALIPLQKDLNGLFASFAPRFRKAMEEQKKLEGEGKWDAYLAGRLAKEIKKDIVVEPTVGKGTDTRKELADALKAFKKANKSGTDIQIEAAQRRLDKAVRSYARSTLSSSDGTCGRVSGALHQANGLREDLGNVATDSVDEKGIPKTIIQIIAPQAKGLVEKDSKRVQQALRMLQRLQGLGLPYGEHEGKQLSELKKLAQESVGADGKPISAKLSQEQLRDLIEFRDLRAQLRQNSNNLQGLERQISDMWQREQNSQVKSSTKDYIDDQGNRGRHANALLNRWIEMAYGAPKAASRMPTKEEQKAAREAQKTSAALEGKGRDAGSATAGSGDNVDVTSYMRTQLSTRIAYAERGALSGKIAELLEKKDYGTLQRMFAEAGSANWTDPKFMARYFALGNTVQKKDLVDPARTQKELDSILNNQNLTKDQKTQKMANLMIDVFPWYRKMRTEGLEAHMRAMTKDLRSSVREGYDYSNADRTNYMGINLMEANRRLQTAIVSNEEMLARGLVPGSKITQQEAVRTGAWIARPEGPWIPATASKPPKPKNPDDQIEMEKYSKAMKESDKRKEAFETYVWPNLAGADRVIYGKRTSPENGWIVDYKDTKNIFGMKQKPGGVFEKATLAALFDLGSEASTVKASITQSWMTMNDMKEWYLDKDYIRQSGERFKVSDLMDEYQRKLLEKRYNVLYEHEYDARMKELKEKLEKEENEEKKKTIENDIKTLEKGGTKGLEKEIDKELSYEKGRLRALTHGLSAVDVIRGLSIEKIPGVELGDEKHDTTGMTFGEKASAFVRQKYGREWRNFDPATARFIRELTRSSYDMAFMGVIAVRSGRAMSSGYGEDGYIATGQSNWGPGLMEPKHGGWITNEWSEAHVVPHAFPVGRWREDIPVLKSMGYGNFMYASTYPAIFAAQWFSTATRRVTSVGDGMPTPWEPQYPKRPGFAKAVGAAATSLPLYFLPLTPLIYPMILMDPMKEGRFARSRLGQAMHVTDIKYGIAKAYSAVGIRNYAMEGPTSLDAFRVGGPSWMAWAGDMFFTSDYRKGYQPVYFNNAGGRQYPFPGFSGTMNRTGLGYATTSRMDWVVPEIFRRETHIGDKLESHESSEKQLGFRKLATLTAPTWGFRKFVYDPIQRRKESERATAEAETRERGKIGPLEAAQVHMGWAAQEEADKNRRLAENAAEREKDRLKEISRQKEIQKKEKEKQDAEKKNKG